MYSDPIHQWVLPPPVFKNWTANQQTGTLTEVESGDLNQSSVSFYFTNSGTKIAKVSFKINGEPAELNVTLNVQTPIASFTYITGAVTVSTSLTGVLRAGLYANAPGNYYGIVFESSVMLPAGWSQGKWNWVQTGTPNISTTTNDGNLLIFSNNGKTGVDTTYPFTVYGPGSHPGDAYGYPTGVASNPGSTYGDSPSIALTDYREFSYTAQFTTCLMFLSNEAESRYVPMQSMDWNVNFSASKNLAGGNWSLQSSLPGVEVTSQPQATTTHPTWTLNIAGTLVPP